MISVISTVDLVSGAAPCAARVVDREVRYGCEHIECTKRAVCVGHAAQEDVLIAGVGCRPPRLPPLHPPQTRRRPQTRRKSAASAAQHPAGMRRRAAVDTAASAAMAAAADAVGAGSGGVIPVGGAAAVHRATVVAAAVHRGSAGARADLAAHAASGCGAAVAETAATAEGAAMGVDAASTARRDRAPCNTSSSWVGCLSTRATRDCASRLPYSVRFAKRRSSWTGRIRRARAGLGL